MVYEEVPEKKLGALGFRPLGLGRGDPLGTRPPHMVYRAEFHRSRSNGTSIRKVEMHPEIGPLEAGPAFPGQSKMTRGHQK